MTQRDEVRNYVLVERHSQRQAAQHFEVSRNTIAKLLAEDPSPVERRYQRHVPRPTPVADQVVPHIEQWLQENAWLDRWHPKQRWTAHRMWSELKTMDLEVAESTVRQLVRARRPATTPAFIPLDFAPGERAEFDFGEASIVLAGQTRTIPFLAGRLRFSGAMFAMAFPTQRQDAFLYGQQQAFAFWGGVPRIIVYDNLKPAVLKMLHGHARQEQAAFTHFHSVYRFEPLFANPRSGWEKGSVENLVGYTRRNFFVPIPEVSG